MPYHYRYINPNVSFATNSQSQNTIPLHTHYDTSTNTIPLVGNMGTYNMTNPYLDMVANTANTPIEALTQELDKLKKQFVNLQVSGTNKSYSMEDLCPFPFDKSIYMPPFPLNFTAPNFNKYRGKGSPIEHVREFHTACLELAYDHTYLMRLFPRSLVGQALEWFVHLPMGIQTWTKLVDKFISHFSYNIEMDVNIATLFQMRQEDGETFISFFQRW